MFIYVEEAFARELQRDVQSGARADLAALLRSEAERWIDAGPWRITDYPSPAVSGNPHDYFSEGPYWWPNPQDPSGPYIRRDGEVNPDHFTAHRKALGEMSKACQALSYAAFYLGEGRYARRAAEVLRTWFLDPDTRMNPHLEYAQAIRGRCDGRGIGIIDSNSLIGLVHSLEFLAATGQWSVDDQQALREWFAAYLAWLMESEKGLEEMRQKNNHGTYWAVQVATFASWLGQDAVVDSMIDRYRDVLVPQQITPEGAQPLEERRTRSFSYTLYNANALALLCELAYHRRVDLWNFLTPDGRGMPRVVAYLNPFLADPQRWSKQQITAVELRPQLFMQWAALRLGQPEYEETNRQLGPLGDSIIGPLALLPRVSL
ncbi:MAG: alginate lyase family protein [Firmicutes bacterium]|nr:alginate lyase family protein [Bacillota bacterium]